ncbi:hypothetical protein LTR35_008938 [Friedmanniomyces endolithicus]|nr:hypothetical protein LTR35_008938 [Friedmanniomyces endolithicus]KAK0295492.1 hypothetical protein LTS00_006123 [Friedmanniomyces endolithicus]KAK1016443.1 hypothetical protein LTR54_003121 [Friedmanniomyces endolithicus]
MQEHVSQYAPALYLDHPPDHSQPQPFLEDEESPELPAGSARLLTSVSSGRPTATATAPVYGRPAVSNAADLLVSMKTGATELFAKLPLQLLTALRCVPNYIEQDIGGHHVYGSLENHRDFIFYRRLLDLFAKGQDLSLLADTKQATGNGWDLDKWKFVPIAYRVYVEQPDIKWYVFLEADAYMGWSNLLELLLKFDPDKPWYLGATHFYGDVAFAHGGMGYIISNGAMRMLDTIWNPQNIARWERRTAAGCCGEVELAAVLQEAGVNITGIPGLYGESLSWFEWDEGKWCERALSWHHTHYVYRDLFHKLVKSHLASTRSDWDNVSRDRVYTGPSGLHGDEDRALRLLAVIYTAEEQTARRAKMAIKAEQALAAEEAFVLCVRAIGHQLRDEREQKERMRLAIANGERNII